MLAEKEMRVKALEHDIKRSLLSCNIVLAEKSLLNSCYRFIIESWIVLDGTEEDGEKEKQLAHIAATIDSWTGTKNRV